MKRVIFITLSVLLLFQLIESCDSQGSSNSIEENKKPTMMSKIEESVAIDEQERDNSIKEIEQPILFDKNKHYRIFSQFTGDEKSLNVMNDDQYNKVNLGETGDNTSQAWKIQSLEEDYYRLTSQWQGVEKSLDIYNDEDDDKKLWLNETSNNTGQAWKIQPIGNGYYRLTTQVFGEGRSLDVLDDGENNSVRLMETGDYSGQLWKITEFK